MSEHSKYSPSAASRWLSCPGSLDYAAEDSSSVYAAEGTVAHAVAAECWALGYPPSTLVGVSRSVDGHEIEITAEMAEAVQVYIDFMESVRDGKTVMIEKRLVSSDQPDFGGTVDAILLDAKNHNYHIVDFKFGAGVAVDAERNLQLSCYAILLQEFLKIETDVSLTIVQPRAYHADGPIRSWVAGTDWLADVRGRLGTVFSGQRVGELNAGDHCRWCPCKSECPEVRGLTLRTAQQEFSQIEMTPETAAEILSKRSAVETYFDHVHNWAHGQAEKGVEIPGYKLVTRIGNRRWAVPAEEVEKHCRRNKISKKLIYKAELLSPAQLEKVAGKDVVADLTERPVLGTSLVPSTDKRPAVKRLTAADEFANLED